MEILFVVFYFSSCTLSLALVTTLYLTREKNPFFTFPLGLEAPFVFYVCFIPIFNIFLLIGTIRNLFKSRSLSAYVDKFPELKILYDSQFIASNYLEIFRSYFPDSTSLKNKERLKLIEKFSDYVSFFYNHSDNEETVKLFSKYENQFELLVQSLTNIYIYSLKPSEELLSAMDSVIQDFIDDSSEAKQSIHCEWFDEEGEDVLQSLNEIHKKALSLEQDSIKKITLALNKKRLQ